MYLSVVFFALKAFSALCCLCGEGRRTHFTEAAQDTVDLWPFLLCGSLLQLSSARAGSESLQQRKAVCSQNLCSAQIQSVPGCQAAVTEARPLPVIINPFAAPALSSHLVHSAAAPSLHSWGTGKGSSSSWGWGAGRVRGSGVRPGGKRVPEPNQRGPSHHSGMVSADRSSQSPHCGVELREPSGCEGQVLPDPSPQEEQIEQDLLPVEPSLSSGLNGSLCPAKFVSRHWLPSPEL